jgi:SAM-dependent methyltransferase
MDAELFKRRRSSFGAAADLYDRIRPSYPADAVRWLFGDEPRRVVDLGAGTGIFSRLLASLGHEVIAVEPDDGMRAKLAATSPGVAALAGSAESIPCPDESVDAVVAAQAYHWFDHDAAHAEIARVLRMGGVFGPIWNVRDESVEWVVDLSRHASLEDGSDSVREWEVRRGFGPHFGPVESAQFHHWTLHTADTLVALVQSRSYYLTADDATRERIESAVRELASRLPEAFELPYVTVAYRATRR